MTAEDVVKKFIDGLNRHDEATYALLSEDVVWQDPGGLDLEGGRDRARKALLSAFKVFSDMRLEPKNIVAMGDWVAVEAVLSGSVTGGTLLVGGKEFTLPASNRRLKTSSAWFFHVNREGLISQYDFYWDNFQFLGQLGLTPDQLGLSV